jgi:4-amino-4-deoxy-L-arabinose transferase-like glycosyltransferase
VALGAGILFLLIVIVGGGFAIRRIVIPKVSNWARVASGIVGLLLVLPFMLPLAATAAEMQLHRREWWATALRGAKWDRDRLRADN